MLELGSCSVSSQSLTGDHNALGLPRAPGGPECPVGGLGMGAMCDSSTPRHHVLHPSPADCESWQKHRAGLARGSSLYSESHSPGAAKSLNQLRHPLPPAHVSPCSPSSPKPPGPLS
ncbi:voltage-dependent R-type calcium channel subunit alpha-1E-like protein [Lates japonicus]|uniref:Voltage-dependent R-type calcium channel subunit alpha-1E-like protein n=1 Tax=Lates japonicus TaxID=270547 RepID=A0AAD3NDL9_LATJO|nr:voltage-dependent R-type calcium channel subunit alpha-1E-like protein [Lates japonicus]